MADYSNEMLGRPYVVKLKYLYLIYVKDLPTFLATKATRPTQSVA